MRPAAVTVVDDVIIVDFICVAAVDAMYIGSIAVNTDAIEAVVIIVVVAAPPSSPSYRRKRRQSRAVYVDVVRRVEGRHADEEHAVEQGQFARVSRYWAPD